MNDKMVEVKKAYGLTNEELLLLSIAAHKADYENYKQYMNSIIVYNGLRKKLNKLTKEQNLNLYKSVVDFAKE